MTLNQLLTLSPYYQPVEQEQELGNATHAKQDIDRRPVIGGLTGGESERARRAPFSHEDYLQNPAKYTHFRTARIAEAIPGIPQLELGQVVNIRFYATRRNSARGNMEMPVYQVWTAEYEAQMKMPSLIYACDLEGFVL